MGKTYLKTICLLAISCIFLASCTKPQAAVEDGFKLYYLNEEETFVVSEPYDPESTGIDDLILELIHALSVPPKNDRYKKAKPDSVQVHDYSYEEGKPLTIYFDNTYNLLEGTTEILSRAAIVSTFCQIDGIDLVEFYVRGQPLALSNELPVGMMKADDFMLITDTLMNYKKEETATVYFANEDGTALVPYHVKTSYDGFVSKEQLIMKLLIMGPMDGACLPTIPENTRINKISVKNKVCYIDLSSDFLEARPDVSEEITIYSIVNSLTEQSSVTNVQFSIDGEFMRNYRNMEFSGLFERNLSLMEEE